MFDSPEAMTFSVRITLLVCVLAPGLLAAATPWLMPRGEVFAVTLPCVTRGCWDCAAATRLPWSP